LNIAQQIFVNINIKLYLEIFRQETTDLWISVYLI